MASVNKVILVGNLGDDPQIAATSSNRAVANVSIATNRKWKDKISGEQKEITTWHRVVFFDKLAQIVQQYLQKGTAVYVEGYLNTRKWEDNSGQTRYLTEVVGQNMQIVSGGIQVPQNSQYEQKSSPQQQPQQNYLGNQQPPDYDYDDDIPF